MNAFITSINTGDSFASIHGEDNESMPKRRVAARCFQGFSTTWYFLSGSYRKAASPKNRVQRAAEELGGKQEAWSLLQMDENPVIAVAKLPALLTLLCARTPALFQAFHKAAVQAAEKPLSLILSFDEATAGNVLAPDPAKKASLHGLHRLQGGWDAKSCFVVACQCRES